MDGYMKSLQDFMLDLSTGTLMIATFIMTTAVFSKLDNRNLGGTNVTELFYFFIGGFLILGAIWSNKVLIQSATVVLLVLVLGIPLVAIKELLEDQTTLGKIRSLVYNLLTLFLWLYFISILWAFQDNL